MDTLISHNQPTFLKVRIHVDGVVDVNEFVDLIKHRKKSCLLFKDDFEKAYDSKRWSFLDYMLSRFVFNVKWRSWIRVCVFFNNVVVLVNCCPTPEISIHSVLKKGDLLAPFLFLLVVEGLSGLISREVDLNLFSGVRVGSFDLVVSHLQYVDDTAILADDSIDNLWIIKAILCGFELASGFRVNFAKSSLIGVKSDQDFLDLVCEFLHLKQESLPFQYPGLPVGANPHYEAT
ncbi:uncharacterized protein LOC127137710 [Lathyrus oleraceus]|uniref:uncharacterized protein LOC127137710 n=1 Tax=Pisum sativum TaxID=3888 RepID=UPI0021D282E2|nr:uncharacterized protein LOC127137710 [Pisum sativum]